MTLSPPARRWKPPCPVALTAPGSRPMRLAAFVRRSRVMRRAGRRRAAVFHRRTGSRGNPSAGTDRRRKGPRIAVRRPALRCRRAIGSRARIGRRSPFHAARPFSVAARAWARRIPPRLSRARARRGFPPGPPRPSGPRSPRTPFQVVDAPRRNPLFAVRTGPPAQPRPLPRASSPRRGRTRRRASRRPSLRKGVARPR